MSCERSRRGCEPVSDCKMRRPTESVDNIVILVCRYPHMQNTSTVLIALIQQFFQQRKSQIVRLSIISESNVGTHTRKPSIHQRTIGGNVSIKPSSQPVNFNDVQINTAIVLSLARSFARSSSIYQASMSALAARREGPPRRYSALIEQRPISSIT